MAPSRGWRADDAITLTTSPHVRARPTRPRGIDLNQSIRVQVVLAVGMALYRIHFVDHGGNVRSTRHVEHDTDEAAIEAAHSLNVLSSVGAGFEVWDDERLVHQHRN